MKKIVLLAVCLLASYAVEAQYIGLKAGYNYATLKGKVMVLILSLITATMQELR